MKIDLDGNSAAERWKKLRGHLKQLSEDMTADAERLKIIEEEVTSLRDGISGHIAKLLELSDLVNEEVQREISLTLNDIDSDIVVDAAPPSIAGGIETSKVDEVLSIEAESAEKTTASKTEKKPPSRKVTDKSIKVECSDKKSETTTASNGSKSKTKSVGRQATLFDDETGSLKDGDVNE